MLHIEFGGSHGDLLGVERLCEVVRRSLGPDGIRVELQDAHGRPIRSSAELGEAVARSSGRTALRAVPSEATARLVAQRSEELRDLRLQYLDERLGHLEHRVETAIPQIVKEQCASRLDAESWDGEAAAQMQPLCVWRQDDEHEPGVGFELGPEAALQQIEARLRHFTGEVVAMCDLNRQQLVKVTEGMTELGKELSFRLEKLEVEAGAQREQLKNLSSSADEVHLHIAGLRADGSGHLAHAARLEASLAEALRRLSASEAGATPPGATFEGLLTAESACRDVGAGEAGGRSGSSGGLRFSTPLKRTAAISPSPARREGGNSRCAHFGHLDAWRGEGLGMGLGLLALKGDERPGCVGTADRGELASPLDELAKNSDEETSPGQRAGPPRPVTPLLAPSSGSTGFVPERARFSIYDHALGWSAQAPPPGADGRGAFAAPSPGSCARGSCGAATAGAPAVHQQRSPFAVRRMPGQTPPPVVRHPGPLMQEAPPAVAASMTSPQVQRWHWDASRRAASPPLVPAALDRCPSWRMTLPARSGSATHLRPGPLQQEALGFATPGRH